MNFRPATIDRSGLWAILVLVLSMASSLAVRADLWNTGYYPGYRQSAIPPTAIDYTALTHIIHFSAIPKTDGTLDTGPNGMSFTRSTNLVAVAHAANRKVLFSVGPAGGNVFTNAASAANLITLCAERKYCCS